MNDEPVRENVDERRCLHQVTLETDEFHCLEVIICQRCGLRAEIPFAELAADTGDGTAVMARYVRAVFGIPLSGVPIETV